MTREKYESLSLTALKDIAKARNIKGISLMKKSELVESMLALDAREAAAKSSDGADAAKNGAAAAKPDDGETSKKSSDDDRRTAVGEESELSEEKKLLDSGEEARGILEVMSDGYGFIRSENYLPGDDDVYVAPSQIRRFGLKTGDIVVGNMRVKNPNDKFGALLFVKTINGLAPSEACKRKNFEDLTPIFPDEKLKLETPGGSIAMRIMDMMCPVGKGQRGMIVSPPKAGKTTLLKDVAKSITRNNPEMHLLILLIDERPEEVTDIKESIEGEQVEVIYSTFDELPEHHKRVSEMVIERAKRLVEHGEDVTILLDSITRLTRAYNLTVQPSGRTLSGGLDPAALHMPKRFFGEALRYLQQHSLTRALKWMMLFTRNSKVPVIWKWYLTESFRRRECSLPSIFPSPERGVTICFSSLTSLKPSICSVKHLTVSSPKKLLRSVLIYSYTPKTMWNSSR